MQAVHGQVSGHLHSLKGVSGRTFDEAKGMLRSILGNEALRFQFLLESDCLSEPERQQYRKLIELNEKGVFSMADELLDRKSVV